ncbi:MAG: 3-hydroxyacyl-CoA dehydrogenase family protein [Desulfitobacterium sp.]
MTQNVAIIGAGTQGSMLAFRSLAFGRRVFLYSRTTESCQKAELNIMKWLDEWIIAGKLDSDYATHAKNNLIVASSLKEAVQDADIIIENLPEILDLKQQIWADIDALAPEHTLLTTNSSSLKSSEIGKFVKRKDKTFNLNFMTPTKDDLVEVMWNDFTSDETKDLALYFLREQNHVPVITHKEIKGFSLNRVWRAIKKESLKLWSEGYTTYEELDRAWMLEWGTAYGPFGLMDRVGLDIVEQIEYSYYAESLNEDDLPPKALQEMVKNGYLGEKSGRGFYRYPNPAYLREGWLRDEHHI